MIIKLIAHWEMMKRNALGGLALDCSIAQIQAHVYTFMMLGMGLLIVSMAMMNCIEIFQHVHMDAHV